MPRLLTAILLLLIAAGCENPPPKQVQEQSCAALDSLMVEIAAFQEAVDAEGGNAVEMERILEGVVEGLAKNQTGPKECNYLNENVHPDHLRFEFADWLTGWTIRDTFTNGIYHLIELRGVFSDDSAISEFFSEEIARVALENPLCYQRYFDQHPAQQQLLLNSTAWSRPDLPELIHAFEAIDSAGKISHFLSSLPPSQNTQP